MFTLHTPKQKMDIICRRIPGGYQWWWPRGPHTLSFDTLCSVQTIMSHAQYTRFSPQSLKSSHGCSHITAGSQALKSISTLRWLHCHWHWCRCMHPGNLQSIANLTVFTRLCTLSAQWEPHSVYVTVHKFVQNQTVSGSHAWCPSK
jgi:hypothetical protein